MPIPILIGVAAWKIVAVVGGSVAAGLGGYAGKKFAIDPLRERGVAKDLARLHNTYSGRARRAAIINYLFEEELVKSDRHLEEVLSTYELAAAQAAAKWPNLRAKSAQIQEPVRPVPTPPSERPHT